jgi:transaldolase
MRGAVVDANSLESLQIKVFADGADLSSMLALAAAPYVKGFTTNPTLMRQAGVDDYRIFAKQVLAEIADRPISFEVFSDDLDEMERQALEIASWADNVNVKIPVTTTQGESTERIVRRLAANGVQLNITALMTLDQVGTVVESLAGGPPAFISVFAGRIADTGRDPVPLMASALELMAEAPNTELIWASPREVLNIVQADAIGCHVITVTHDLLKKAANLGKDLDEFSLETVQMFRTDAVHAGFTL